MTTKNLKPIIKFLTGHNDTQNITVKQINTAKKSKKSQAIYAQNIETFEKIKTKIRNEKVEFFTYMSSAEKKKIFVIKRLN